MLKENKVVRGTVLCATEFLKILIVLFALLFIADLQIDHHRLLF